MIGDLLATLLAYPTLSRTATGALTDMAEAMKHSSTSAEIDALLQGAMTEEAYVRFACLQALSVRSVFRPVYSSLRWLIGNRLKAA